MESNLKPKQLNAAVLIVSGERGKDIAHKIGVTPETISHWKSDPAFQAMVNQLKSEMLERASDEMRILAADAVATIRDVMISGQSETARLKAASMVLKWSLNLQI